MLPGVAENQRRSRQKKAVQEGKELCPVAVWKAYCGIVRKVSKISAYIAAVATILMSLIIFVEIIYRNFFGASTMIADEFGSYFLCASTFFAGPLLMAEDGFLRVDILYTRFSGMTKKICDGIIWVTGIVCCCYMLRFCFHVVQSSYNISAVSAYVTKTPMVYPQSIMVIGFALLILEMIVKLGEVFLPSMDEEGKGELNA